MSLKELKISEMMDSYTDNEFFIEGETEVSAQAVKDRALPKVNTVRHLPGAARIFIAAAAAAVVVLSAMAAAATVIIKSVQTLDNSLIDIEADDDTISIAITDQTDVEAPLRLEDGRLWFTGNGQNVDITDLIDEETPYIYSYTSSETGDVHYFIVGGAPGDYGYIELFPMPENGLNVGWEGVGENGLADGFSDEIGEYSPYKQWLAAALDELGLDWQSMSTSWRYGAIPGQDSDESGSQGIWIASVG